MRPLNLALPLALPLALCALACSSAALSPGDPSQLRLSFEPPALIEVDEGEVVATATDVDLSDDLGGDPRRWSVQSWDFGPDLELRSWEFQSNFTLRLRVGVFPSAEVGAHALRLELHNDFGTFVATGELFVFPL